ncbi:putative ATP-dependent RNA helicase DHX30 [Acanthaster planci]|uniref:ATP-dependent RNA helicase DHX30 n=1 Tax=Acanthaster planci TaxID=133434 RepID=A0A8B7Y0A2_ACAPL|nr:putative ATP-dependent RNA helicase DHX30 [Acanthaster planci]
MARAAEKALTGLSAKFLAMSGCRLCQLCHTRHSYVYRLHLFASYHTSLVNEQRKRKRKQKASQVEIPTILSEEGERALEEFQNPKSCLHNVLALVAKDGKAGNVCQYKLQPAQGNSKVKQSVLSVTWPQEFTVVGLGRRRTQAEKMAAALACAKLKEFGALDDNNKPRIAGQVLHNKEDIKEQLWRESRPDWIGLEPDLGVEIKQVLQAIKARRIGSAWREPADHDESRAESFETLFDCDSPEDQLSDAITGKPYQEMTESRAEWKNNYLVERQELLEDKAQQDSEERSVREEALKLPIADMREEILGLVRDNQVVVLSGETGCGKTTQVPQYLLEEWIHQDKGAHCNVVVTQPRRISAVSVAERVALERGEQVGNTIGYQVRLSSKLPYNNGCILFCTTGILLKKLESNPSLTGISHVIVDEVHERDINTDFLLILLKNLLRDNPNLKLILMSASINAQLISSYFNDCPMISVPGFMYPVKEYYLEDVSGLLGAGIGAHGKGNRASTSMDEECDVVRPLTDVDLAVNIIKFIDESRPPGAILCFLPGWQDIRSVCDRLKDILPNSGKHLILPVHSSVPLSAQQDIFERPPHGIRKIVLATNIAETSITINDVVYVVNPGNHKEDRYDVNLGVSCLDVQWISKANVRQRKGRAGRCQPGECYHFFSKNRYLQLEDYQAPEMLRIPLEQIVVQAKVHFRDMSAASLLSQAMQPPPLSAVEKAVEVLQDLAILKDDESLTALGDKIVGISADPRLAKALVLSAVFRCVSPVLTVAAGMHTRPPFLDSMENRAAILKIRKSFAEDSCSDHVAQIQLYEAWEQAMYAYEVRTFNKRNLVYHSTMLFIQGLRKQLADNLEEASLVASSKGCLHGNDTSNEFAFDNQLVKGVLCGAFFPNLLRARRGRIERSRMKLRQLVYKDMESNVVLLSRRSVNCTEKSFPSRWLTYFSKARNEQIFIHDTSVVHPLAVLCMTGRKVHVAPLTNRELQTQLEENTIQDPDTEIVKLIVTRNGHSSRNSPTYHRTPVAFYTTYETAMALVALIREVNIMVDECLKADHIDQLPQDVKDRHEDVLEILQKVINSPQSPFVDAGQNNDSDATSSRSSSSTLNLNLTAW